MIVSTVRVKSSEAHSISEDEDSGLYPDFFLLSKEDSNAICRVNVTDGCYSSAARRNILAEGKCVPLVEHSLLSTRTLSAIPGIEELSWLSSFSMWSCLSWVCRDEPPPLVLWPGCALRFYSAPDVLGLCPSASESLALCPASSL